MRGRLAAGLACVLLVLGTGFDPWQTTWRETREGNRALAEGNAEEAVRHYTEALSRSPDDPRILFDLGNALARLGRLDEARQAWDRAAQLGSGTIRRDAWYNRGLAELLGGDAKAAAEAFTRALLTDPGDEEARHNLDLALRRLQQQEQQQQQQGGRQQQQDQEQQQRQGRSGNRGEDDRDREQERQQADRDRRREQQQERQQGKDRQERQQGQQGDRQAPRPGEEQRREERRRQAGAGKQADRADREAQEMAERLLRRLAEDEKDALRRALRRRIPAGKKKRGKDW